MNIHREIITVRSIEYLTLGLAFEMSITAQQLTFLTHPVCVFIVIGVHLLAECISY